jgi:hypothetical protein
VLDLAVQAGAVKRSGAYFAYGEERPELVKVIAREVRS